MDAMPEFPTGQHAVQGAVRKVYIDLYVPNDPSADEVGARCRHARKVIAGRRRDEETRQRRFEEARKALLEMAEQRRPGTHYSDDIIRLAIINLDHGEALEEHRARGFVESSANAERYARAAEALALYGLGDGARLNPPSTSGQWVRP